MLRESRTFERVADDIEIVRRMLMNRAVYEASKELDEAQDAFVRLRQDLIVLEADRRRAALNAENWRMSATVMFVLGAASIAASISMFLV